MAIIGTAFVAVRPEGADQFADEARADLLAGLGVLAERASDALDAVWAAPDPSRFVAGAQSAILGDLSSLARRGSGELDAVWAAPVAASAFVGGVAGSIIGDLSSLATRGANELEPIFDSPADADRFVDDAEPGILGKIRGLAGSIGPIIAGAFAVVGIGAVFAEGLEREGLQARLAGQLGNLDPAAAAAAGEAAGRVYNNNFGESLGEVNDTVSTIVRNLGISADDPSLQAITEQALTLADTFDLDVNGVLLSIRSQLDSGLAPSATSALDTLTRGLQSGANAGDDLLDSLSEYTLPLSHLGLDSERATALFSRGMEAGARNTDVLSDALQEFTILGTDGSEGVAEAFATIGLNAADTSAAILAGGDASQAALSATIQGLAAMEDPVARNIAGVSLFGAQYEIFGQGVLDALDPATVALEDSAGAAAELAQITGDTVSGSLEGLKRTVMSALVAPMVEFVVPVLGEVVGGFTAFFAAFRAGDGDITSSGFAGNMERWANVARDVYDAVVPIVADVLPRLGAALSTVIGFLADTVRWLSDNRDVAIAIGAVIAGLTLVYVGYTVATRTIALATRAWTAIQAVWNSTMLANPVVLVVGALVLLGAAIFLAYQRFQGFRDVVDAVFGFITDTILPALQVAFQATMDFITTQVVPVLEQLWAVAQVVFEAIATVIGVQVAIWRTIIETFITIIQTAWDIFGGRILSVIQTVWEGIRGVFQAAVDVIKGIIDVFMGVFTGDWGRAWDGIKGIFTGIWDGMRAYIGTIIAVVFSAITAPLDLFRAAWERVWGAIASFFSGVWDGIKATASTVIDGIKAVVSTGIDGIVGFVTGLPGRITSAVSGAFDSLKTGFKNALNIIIDLINGFHVPSLTIGGFDPLGSFGPSVPEVTIGGWSLPHIPRLALGGVIDQPTLALLGEGNGPELASPVSLMADTFRKVLAEGLGGQTVVQINAPVYGVDDLQAAIVGAIAEADRQRAQRAMAGRRT